MRSILWTLLFSCALSGCSVAVNGQERTGSASVVSVSSETQVRSGHGSAGVSFGTPAPAGAPGGHASLSRGASVALILTLLVADLVHYLTPAPATRAHAPGVSIAETCSCYGYRAAMPDASRAPVEKAMP